MSIITKSELLGARGYTGAISYRINESLTNFRNESSLGKVKIFLSHKHGENEELLGAINFLKQFGVEIYVDWQDEGMPKKTSGKTAKRIKQKIKENKKFILLATDAAIASKWCNWELGLGDGEKYIDHIALLPVKSNMLNYEGGEYLEIYPYINKSDTIPNYYHLKYPDGTTKSLLNWLKT